MLYQYHYSILEALCLTARKEIVINMRITWIGQAGFLIDTREFKIMVDPYLSDSVEAINPKNWRRVAVDESFFEEDIDILPHIS